MGFCNLLFIITIYIWLIFVKNEKKTQFFEPFLYLVFCFYNSSTLTFEALFSSNSSLLPKALMIEMIMMGIMRYFSTVNPISAEPNRLLKKPPLKLRKIRPNKVIIPIVIATLIAMFFNTIFTIFLSSFIKKTNFYYK